MRPAISKSFWKMTTPANPAIPANTKNVNRNKERWRRASTRTNVKHDVSPTKMCHGNVYQHVEFWASSSKKRDLKRLDGKCAMPLPFSSFNRLIQHALVALHRKKPRNQSREFVGILPESIFSGMVAIDFLVKGKRPTLPASPLT